MTWVRVWLPPDRTASITGQRGAITQILNARVLRGGLEARLREAAHVLAAVDDALTEPRNRGDDGRAYTRG